MTNNDEWFRIVCESYINNNYSYNGLSLPQFPPESIQINTTGLSGKEALHEAFVFYEDCINVFNGLGASISREDKILDFGVGWGRIARFFLRDIPVSNLYGIDVMDEFIKICRDTFNSPNFSITNPFPPTQFENNFFDYVVGYSVFSHLSEKACFEWMKEFSRIVKPGGVVALTTRGRPFFDYCESLKGQNMGQYADSLSTMFPCFDNARKSYDEGSFVHSNANGVTGNGESQAYFYGETFIPEEYAKTAYADLFHLEAFLYNPERQSHPIMFFKKLG